MAYPVLYDVTYSYTGFQQAQGGSSFPGTQLDADLAGLEGSIDDLATFVENVMRSDGKLANASVDFDQLSVAVKAQLGDITAVAAILAAKDNAVAAASGAAVSSAAAAGSATAAAGSATAASGSATTAAGSATAASGSATAAAASATVIAGNQYAFETSATMSAPAAGGLRFNNASPALATALAVSAQSSANGNPDVSDFVATWGASSNTPKGTVQVRKIGSPGVFAIFNVTSAVIDNGTWLQVAATYVSGSGAFASNDALSVQFTRAGDSGGLNPANNLSDVASAPVAVRNLAPTDLNLSGTPNGSSPRIKSYADSSRVVFGKEYLSAWINAWRTGTALARPVLLRGDSTMVGSGLSSPAYTAPDKLFSSIAAGKGVRILAPVNLGVGGTTTADWLNTHLPSDLATYTGGNIPRLYIINYGMNDPYVGPLSQAQTIANLRAGFALLRATWNADSTSVVYMMPNTSYDDTNSRNETWRETIVSSIKQVCRDYGVMFFDTYAALREARYGLLTGWLNATDKVHPADDFSLAIWGEFVDALIPSSVIDAATRPLKVTPATGFTLPGTAEDMNTCAVGRMGIGSGYLNMTTPATIAAGTTLATIHAFHVPLTQAWAVQMAAFSGAWQFFQGIITTAGVVTNQQAISISASRIYFGPGNWQR